MQQLNLTLTFFANQISSDNTYYAYEMRKADKLIVISKYDFKDYKFIEMTPLRKGDVRSVKVKNFDFQIPLVKKIDNESEFKKSFKEYYINETK